MSSAFDPFGRGPYPAGVRTVHAPDAARDRVFPCELWYPAHGEALAGTAESEERRDAVPLPGPHALIVYSHGSGLHRRSAGYLCRHLAGHGYVVAALDHSEVVAPQLTGRAGESPAERAARIAAIIGSRVPDVRFLLDFLLAGGSGELELDGARIGLVGYSFGGWTVLATTEIEPRVSSVVAMGAGGGSNPRPGILPVTLSLAWSRDVPALYLAAEDDVLIPLPGIIELFERTPAAKRMFVLRRADHQHFIDDVEGIHEAMRGSDFPGDGAWIPAAMRPMGELCSGDQAHLFTRGLTLAHLDATLRRLPAAQEFLQGDVAEELAARGVAAWEYAPVD